MALLYPTTRFPQYGYKSWQAENVIRNDAQAPKYQEKDLWNRTIFRASLQYDLRKDDILVVYAFWKQIRVLAQTGQPYTFDFFDFDDDIYLDSVLGTSNGTANQVFDIPGNKARLWSWKINGVLQNAANATLQVGTGTNGRDRLLLSGSTPANGTTITISYTGHGCFTSCFLKAPEKSSNAYGRQTLTVEITERP